MWRGMVDLPGLNDVEGGWLISQALIKQFEGGRIHFLFFHFVVVLGSYVEMILSQLSLM